MTPEELETLNAEIKSCARESKLDYINRSREMMRAIVRTAAVYESLGGDSINVFLEEFQNDDELCNLLKAVAEIKRNRS